MNSFQRKSLQQQPIKLSKVGCPVQQNHTSGESKNDRNKLKSGKARRNVTSDNNGRDTRSTDNNGRNTRSTRSKSNEAKSDGRRLRSKKTTNGNDKKS